MIWDGYSVAHEPILIEEQLHNSLIFSVSARDIYHDTVKRSLQKAGWVITHDPFPLKIGKKRLSADLGAERLISAENTTRKIVVEVKSFVGQSDVKDLEQALGQ